MNKVYIAYSGYTSFSDGSSDTVIGVFSSKEKAIAAIKEQHNFFKYKETPYDSWVYHFDGELTQSLSIEERQIDVYG